MKRYKISWENIDTGEGISIYLYSKFTCILGKDSGEGKSFFFDYLKDNLIMDFKNDESDDSESRRVQAIVDDPSIKFLLWDDEFLDICVEMLSQEEIRCIFLIDEMSMLRSSFLESIKKSCHLFICISRGMPLKVDYPLMGLYEIVYKELDNGGTMMDIVNMKSLPLAKSFKNRFKTIITESSKGKSEGCLLDAYKIDYVPAGGRDKLSKRLRRVEGSTLVLADLGNIGFSYGVLMDLCSKNRNIVFYNYICFEQLLYCSDLVQSLEKRPIGKDCFDMFSLERYYEYLMEIRTKGTELEYSHSTPVLAKGYIDSSNFERVFSSKIAQGLKEYIINFGEF